MTTRSRCSTRWRIRGGSTTSAAGGAALGRAHARRGDALGRAPARRRQAADARRPPRRAGDVPRPRRGRRASSPATCSGACAPRRKLRDYVAALIAAPSRRRLPRPRAAAGPPHDLALPAGDPALQRRHHDLHRRRPPRHARRQRRAGDRGPPRGGRELLAPPASRPGDAPLVRGDELSRGRGRAPARASARSSPSSRRTASRA